MLLQQRPRELTLLVQEITIVIPLKQFSIKHNILKYMKEELLQLAL